MDKLSARLIKKEGAQINKMRKGQDFIGPSSLISLRTIAQFHLPLVLLQIVDDVTKLQCVIIFIFSTVKEKGLRK